MKVLGRRQRRWVLLQAVLATLQLAGMFFGAGAASGLEVGDTAPDFLLPSTTGEKISLRQFRDKALVLIEFYVGESPT